MIRAKWKTGEGFCFQRISFRDALFDAEILASQLLCCVIFKNWR